MHAFTESREDKQKRIEGSYLAEARKVSSVFPPAEFRPFKPYPDFVADDVSLGIEVTELCDPDGRSDGARLSLVVPRAKQIYMSRPDAPALSVATGMAPQAEDMRVDDLAQSLADFVYEHRHERGEIRDENFGGDYEEALALVGSGAQGRGRRRGRLRIGYGRRVNR